MGLLITKLRKAYCSVCKRKKLKIDEYLAKLQARAWLSHALSAPGQQIAKTRRKCMFLLVTLPNIHRFKKITDTLRLLLRPREGSAEYCDERVCVCVFVCPRSCLRNYTSDLHGIFCACYPWPWLGPPLAAYTLCIEQTLP